MSDSAPWTIGRLLEWTTDYLKQQGSTSARLDAEVLLAHARGCQRIELYTAFNEQPDEVVRQSFRELVKQRAAGKPVAYLVGGREFYSLHFTVTQDVLIPRPETEELVVALLDLVKRQRRTQQELDLADVGTGSGCLAVAVAKHLPRARVTAIDCSGEALEVARENAEYHQVSDRITFLASDLFESVSPDAEFDFIVSNPPYIGLEEKPELPRDVVDFEPPQALFAGRQGLDVISRLLPQAAERLKPNGWLIIEINSKQVDSIRQLAERLDLLTDVTVLDDIARLPRLLLARRAA